MEKIIFLDTNILLHYKDFDQVNWCEVAQADSITIIIPPVTIRELNKQKELHPKKRVRNRAGLILKKFSKLFSSDLLSKIREGILLRLEDRDPQIEMKLYDLNQEIQDDQLIASILSKKIESPKEEIVLITADYGLTLLAKAKRHGISTVRLSDDHKLPEELDPFEVQIRELEREVRELKSRSPDLSLIFEDKNQHATFVIPAPLPEISTSELESKLNEIKNRYPKKPVSLEKEEETDYSELTAKQALARIDLSFRSMFSTEDIIEYNDELDKYFKEYAEYLSKVRLYENYKCRTIKISIWITNDGTAPAEDIDVFLQFPDGFTLVSEDDYPTPPKTPTPPSFPRTALDKISGALTGYADHLSMPPFAPASNSPPPNISYPNIRRTNSYEVHLSVQRLKHLLWEPFDPLYITFDSFDAAQSFHIDSQIIAANMPKEISGKLHVIIQKGT